MRGELVLVLGPANATGAAVSDEQLDRAIDAALAAGSAPSAIAKALAGESAHSRQTLYARVIERKISRERAGADGS